MTDALHANTQAEQLLLGAILSENRALSRVRDEVGLKPEDFAFLPHGKIYDACATLIDRGERANPITLRTFFADDALLDVGGPDYLLRLVGSSVATVEAPSYARIIADLSARRTLAATLEHYLRAVNEARYEVTAPEMIGAAASAIQAIGSTRQSVEFKSRRDVMLSVIESMKSPPPADPTGLPTLDLAMGGGLFARRSYGFAARLKAGKTTLLGTISFNLNERGVRHLYIAGEMSAEELEHRNMARAMRTNSLRFMRRESSEFVGKAARYAVTAPDATIYQTAPGITFDHLKRSIANAVSRHRIKGVIFDYLQLTQGKPRGQSTAEFYDEVAQWIANYARQEGIWAMVACQLNQDENTRGGEGIKLAFDQVYKLKRTEFEPPMAWLDMMASRYTGTTHVGSEDNPALILDPFGPHFREAGQARESAA